MEEIFYPEQNFVMEHFLVRTISGVNFEVREQPNPNRVAKTEMECRCSVPVTNKSH
jgi:hypothetical protein